MRWTSNYLFGRYAAILMTMPGYIAALDSIPLIPVNVSCGGSSNTALMFILLNLGGYKGMKSTNVASIVLEEYKRGKRLFQDLYIYNESFEGEVLEGIIFQGCTLYVNFRNANLRNARFQNGGVKTCDFRDADLTGSSFENLSVESAQFARAKTKEVYWNNNFSYGGISTQEDFESWIKDHEE